MEDPDKQYTITPSELISKLYELPDSVKEVRFFATGGREFVIRKICVAGHGSEAEVYIEPRIR